ncbi:MAG: xanthine dehydrogenase family protein molybdopterin-binding subunit, partial [Rhodospirillales bacterium]|nr:xanthine dehydrogenase family protein molybdopterin-binding subunit [Rhodospirillales bacterium]
MASFEAKSVRRREDARLLTGRGTYVGDPRPAGLLNAVFLRSPQAHARVLSIDPASARTMPGVVGVFTAADLTDVGPIPGGINFPRPDGSPAPKT